MKLIDIDKLVPYTDKVEKFKISSSLLNENIDGEYFYFKSFYDVEKNNRGWLLPIEISFKEKIPDLPSGKYVITLSDLHIFYSMRDLEALINIPDMVEDERVEEIKASPKSRRSIATDARNMLCFCVSLS